MERRRVLKITAWMTGSVLTAPLVSSVLSGCQEAKLDPTAKLKLLDDEQFFFLNKIVEIILPEGEIPGAISLGVPQMIDHMVAVTYSPKKQMEYLRGLNVANKLWNNELNQFSQESAENRMTFLKQLEIDIKDRAAKKAETGLEKKEAVTVTEDFSAKVEKLQEENLSMEEQLEISDAFFQELKQQAIAYYLSTEEINTKYLNYLPVPGEYQACIPLSEIGGKAWAI